MGKAVVTRERAVTGVSAFRVFDMGPPCLSTATQGADGLEPQNVVGGAAYQFRSYPSRLSDAIHGSRHSSKAQHLARMGCTGCFTQQVRLCLFLQTGEVAIKSKNPEDIDEIAVMGADIGKDTFHLVGFDDAGQRVLRKKIRRLALKATFDALPRCVVGMEACMSAHFVSRMPRELGFEPRIIPAIYVTPFNKGQKNDYTDAEAIAEAAMRPNLRTVTEKSQDPLDLQAMHRVRSRLVARRTARINQIRAFLIEQGITVRAGRHRLQGSFEAILENRRDEISPRMRSTLMGLYGDWLWVDKRIKAILEEIEEISKSEESSRNIITIPGIGPLISTAIVAAIGQGEVFDRGRDFAACSASFRVSSAPEGGQSLVGSASAATAISGCSWCRPPTSY